MTDTTKYESFFPRIKIKLSYLILQYCHLVKLNFAVLWKTKGKLFLIYEKK